VCVPIVPKQIELAKDARPTTQVEIACFALDYELCALAVSLVLGNHVLPELNGAMQVVNVLEPARAQKGE
jgi:hypothetical protein